MLKVSVNIAELKRYRHMRGFRQNELEKLAKLPVNSVSRFECERDRPTVDEVQALAEALDVKPRSLVSEDGWTQLVQQLSNVGFMFGYKVNLVPINVTVY
jgi:transcriptional regulator with XRE-family HTH domain